MNIHRCWYCIILNMIIILDGNKSLSCTALLIWTNGVLAQNADEPQNEVYVVWARVSHKELCGGDEFHVFLTKEKVEIEMLKYFQGKFPDWPARNLIDEYYLRSRSFSKCDGYFTCQLSWATGCPDSWLNIISGSVFEGISRRG